MLQTKGERSESAILELTSLKWNIAHSDSAPSDPAAVDRLARALKLAPAAARVLWARNYRDPDEARRFLAPVLADLHDPWRLRDMAAAVDRLLRAIEQASPSCFMAITTSTAPAPW